MDDGRTPEQARMRLRSKPTRPRSLPGADGAKLVWREGMPLTWRSYLRSVLYWHASLED